MSPYGSWKSGTDSYAFDIKVHRVDIPDKVSDRIGSEEIQEIYENEAGFTIGNLIDSLRTRFPWIENIRVEGRSGGWLVLDAEDSVVERDREGYLVATPEALKRLDELEGIADIIEEEKRNFIGRLGSYAWWSETFPSLLNWVPPGKKEWRPDPDPDSH